jgi:putative transposase
MTVNPLTNLFDRGSPFQSGPLFSGWIELVQQPRTDAELLTVCTSIQRGSPLGTPACQRRTAERLGLESTLRPRGRPR